MGKKEDLEDPEFKQKYKENIDQDGGIDLAYRIIRLELLLTDVYLPRLEALEQKMKKVVK